MTGQPKSEQRKVEPTVADEQLPSTSAASTSAEEEKDRPNTRARANVKATAQAEREIFGKKNRDMVQSGDPNLRPIAYAWPNPTLHNFDNMPDYLTNGSRGSRMSFVYTKDRKTSDYYKEDPVMPCQVFERETTAHVAYFHYERYDVYGTRVVCSNRPCRVEGLSNSTHKKCKRTSCKNFTE